MAPEAGKALVPQHRTRPGLLLGQPLALCKGTCTVGEGRQKGPQRGTDSPGDVVLSTHSTPGTGGAVKKDRLYETHIPVGRTLDQIKS